jgi:hypothetical protein
MNDLDDVMRLLREQRPELSGLELDEIERRVRRRAARPESRKGQSMRSRLAILMMLVLGMLLSTAGAGMAISTISSGDSASIAQYPDNDADDDAGDVRGEEDFGGGVGGGDDDAPAGAEDVQPTRQAEAGAQGEEDQLPFTGFAAIPVLLGGVALLTGGLVLRKRAGQDQ